MKPSPDCDLRHRIGDWVAKPANSGILVAENVAERSARPEIERHRPFLGVVLSVLLAAENGRSTHIGAKTTERQGVKQYCRGNRATT
jgi:hypothetical protein